MELMKGDLILKFSTRSKYGLKALLEIAISEETCISLQTISNKLGVSVNYLEQIIAVLKKQGVVESIRGAKGGYKLARSTDEITLGEVLRALEGNLCPVNCLDGTQKNEKVKCSCGDKCSSDCLTQIAWQKIYTVLIESVDNITLKDIIEKNV